MTTARQPCRAGRASHFANSAPLHHVNVPAFLGVVPWWYGRGQIASMLSRQKTKGRGQPRVRPRPRLIIRCLAVEGLRASVPTVARLARVPAFAVAHAT